MSINCSVEKYSVSLDQVSSETCASECSSSVALSNATSGLHAACLALDLKEGDIGITSPVTFLASANCIAYCGATPDFVDVDEETFCLSPSKLEEYIKKY